MLEDYAKIQPAVKKDIDDAVNTSVQSLQSSQQYDYSKIQSHAHTGIDSLQVAFPSLQNASQYRVLRRVTLTSPQILNLFTTPVELIPALGPGVITIVEEITGFLDYGGTAYVAPDDLEFRYTDGSGAIVAIDMPSTFLQNAGDRYQHTLADPGYEAVANEPVVVLTDTNPTTGNSTLTFLVVYRTVSFAS